MNCSRFNFCVTLSNNQFKTNNMKKAILTLAFVSALAFFSCKESTQDKVEEATEAVGEEIETATENTIDAIDSTATEVGNDIKNGVEEVKEEINEVEK